MRLDRFARDSESVAVVYVQELETRRLLAIATSTVLASSLNPSTFGQSITLTATVNATSGTPTGNVTFKDGSVVLGTAPLNAQKKAIFSTTLLSAGTRGLQAFYAGNTTFNSSNSTLLSQKVNAAGTTTTLTKSLASTTWGQSLKLTATVAVKSPGGGTPIGTVTFKNGTTTLGTVALNSSRQAVLTLGNLPVGALNLTAVYNGTTNHATSTSAIVSHVVAKAATTTVVTRTPTSSVLGQGVTIKATISSTVAGGAFAGSIVTFKNGPTVIGTAAVNSSNFATLVYSGLPVGNASLTAVFPGTTNYNTSTSAAVVHAVSAASTTTTVTLSSSTAVMGQSVTISAKVAPVSPGAGVPSGTVTFKDGTIVLGTGTLSNGVATLSVYNLFQGTHSITAAFAATTSYKASTSAAKTLTVTAPTYTTTSTGLKLATIVAGTGAAVNDKHYVTVDYTGYLLDGSKFDSSLNEGRTPFQFTLGIGSVIQGWDQGVKGMKPGEIRVLNIPSSLGYGATGQGSIPPNATLVFIVKLISFDTQLQVFGGTNFGTKFASGAAASTAVGTAFASRTVGTSSAAISIGLGAADQSFPLQLTTNPFVQIAGANPNDFIITQPSSTNGFVLSVVFKPTAKGARSAQLKIATNDPNLPVFIINVTGTGL
jgi:FKBP-type peptidyl-prolyl cis-trans isomerase